MRLLCPLCGEGDDLVVHRTSGAGWEYTCPRGTAHPSGEPYGWSYGGQSLEHVSAVLGRDGAAPSSAGPAATLLEPERITTMEEVRARLITGRASFEDWLDCAHVAEVAEVAEDWDILGECSKRALAAVLQRPFKGPRLREAAEIVVRAHLIGAEDIEALTAALQAARGALDAALEEPALSPELRAALEDQRTALAEMLILIADGSPASLVQLARALREMRRSELAAICASHALVETPDNPVALTSRGAAFLDQGLLTEAHQDLSRAHRLRPSVYTERALSRSCRLRGDHETAVEHAWTAARMEPSAFSARLLAAAAIAAGNDDALAAAEEMSAQFPSGIRDNAQPHRQLQLAAAKQFLRDHEYAAAIVVLESLLRQGWWKTADDVRLDAEHRLAVATANS